MSPNLIIIHGGFATPQFHAAWRERAQGAPGPVLALPARLRLITPALYPTPEFASIYRQAWGQSLNLQTPVVDNLGRPSQEFLALWP